MTRYLLALLLLGCAPGDGPTRPAVHLGAALAMMLALSGCQDIPHPWLPMAVHCDSGGSSAFVARCIAGVDAINARLGYRGFTSSAVPVQLATGTGCELYEAVNDGNERMGSTNHGGRWYELPAANDALPVDEAALLVAHGLGHCMGMPHATSWLSTMAPQLVYAEGFTVITRDVVAWARAHTDWTLAGGVSSAPIPSGTASESSPAGP